MKKLLKELKRILVVELLVIPCSKEKIWDKNPNLGKVEARKAYIGTFTKLAIEYAEKFYKKSYVILSAKYGFLFPWEKIENYDVRFGEKGAITVEELKRQAKEKGLLKYNEIISFCGKKYTEVLRKVFEGRKILEPFRGLKYGERIGKLKELITNEIIFF